MVLYESIVYSDGHAGSERGTDLERRSASSGGALCAHGLHSACACGRDPQTARGQKKCGSSEEAGSACREARTEDRTKETHRGGHRILWMGREEV